MGVRMVPGWREYAVTLVPLHLRSVTCMSGSMAAPKCAIRYISVTSCALTRCQLLIGPAAASHTEQPSQNHLVSDASRVAKAYAGLHTPCIATSRALRASTVSRGLASMCGTCARAAWREEHLPACCRHTGTVLSSSSLCDAGHPGGCCRACERQSSRSPRVLGALTPAHALCFSALDNSVLAYMHAQISSQLQRDSDTSQDQKAT